MSLNLNLRSKTLLLRPRKTTSHLERERALMVREKTISQLHLVGRENTKTTTVEVDQLVQVWQLLTIKALEVSSFPKITKTRYPKYN